MSDIITRNKQTMEPVDTAISQSQKPPSSPGDLAFARSYQLEALERAIKQNTLVYLETGSGKTLIAIMLLRHYAYRFRKPSLNIAVFLVPKVVLVTQQADALMLHTNLKVGKYWGEMGVDFWDAAVWKGEQEKYEVLVMTPAILLHALRHSFIKLEMIQVLIFDECHNARGNHPYACIMKECYHRQLSSSSGLPRILGLTASPVKAKGSDVADSYWKQISDLENLMHSKVYTCESESVLAKYIPFASTQIKLYKQSHIPDELSRISENGLAKVLQKHKSSLQGTSLANSSKQSLSKKLEKLSSTFMFCLSELGLWLACEAAKSLSSLATEVSCWEELDAHSQNILKHFILDVRELLSAHIPSGSSWSICHDMKADIDAGLITTKVSCLVECLLQYGNCRDLRSIVFVERVITATVLNALLNKRLPQLFGWNTKYIAGNQSVLQTQSRNAQNKIVEEFRKGQVNIIVATSIVEEGLDVQSCNLVVRFDPSDTVCSFIQSKGRARKQNSHFVLMVDSEDPSAISRLKTYISSGEIMRKESLRHASLPCRPVEFDPSDEFFYRVESTGANVTLSSSVELVYFYCSRLPSDGYFKPTPRCKIDEAEGCTIQFPHSCPIQPVTIKASGKMVKQLACLKACIKLHKIGALTDNLVPDIVAEEAQLQELVDQPYNDEHAMYIPHQLVTEDFNNCTSVLYHCYLIKIETNVSYGINMIDIVFCVKTELDFDNENMHFNMEDEYGDLIICLKYLGRVSFTYEEILLCRRFHSAVFGALMDKNFHKMTGLSIQQLLNESGPHLDYILLPSSGPTENSINIDWTSVKSVLFLSTGRKEFCRYCHDKVYTRDGIMCRCVLDNCLVYTPHNGRMYCICGSCDDLNGSSVLRFKDGSAVTYKEHFKTRHGIELQYEKEALLRGKCIFGIQNCLQIHRQQKERDPDVTFVELPPELCCVIMSPISISTFYTFSFLPSIMHRIESLLLSAYLKTMIQQSAECADIHVDHCLQSVHIPTTKVLEAITTKKCQERYNLESLEILGDSFLKYSVSQQLFRTYQNHHEGLLSVRREKIISNGALCKLGCERNITSFIRDEPFDPKTWVIPGDSRYKLEVSWTAAGEKLYSRMRRISKRKRVADVVEALIGAFLSSGGELAALIFMDWLGLEVDFTNSPCQRHLSFGAERLVNVNRVESILKYSFHDKSLLVEALTHGSYMLAEFPRCYQRLEFLGDAVLDHLITIHLYNAYPGISPGLLTDLRSASVNNHCYAKAAVQAGLYKDILHASDVLHKQIVATVRTIEESPRESTYGWDVDSNIPKVLADVIESLAGAIFVDSGYNKEIVFKAIRPLLEPLIAPETLKIHPVKELDDICTKHRFKLKKPVSYTENGVSLLKLEVEANDDIFEYHCYASDKKTGKRLASKGLLSVLKDNIPGL